MAQYVWEPFLLTPDDRNRSSFWNIVLKRIKDDRQCPEY
jgi:hypothetical protein